MTSRPDMKVKRAPLWVRGAIWAVGVMLMLAAGASAGLLTTTPPPQVPLAAPSALPAQTSSAGATPSAALASRYAGEDAVGLLPAYRWNDVGLSTVNETGIENTASNGAEALMSGITSVMFSAQAFMWNVLVDLLALAFDFSLLTDNAVTTRLNDGFVAVSSAVFGSGLIFLPLLIAVFLVVRAFMSGSSAKVGRIMVGAVVPIGMLWALTAQAESAGSNATTTGPVGLAVTATSLIETGAQSFGSGFGTLDNAGITMPPAANASPGCESYTNVLYSQYDALRDPPRTVPVTVAGSTTYIETSSGTVSAGSAMLPQVSYMWERAFLNNWRQAQYGDTDGSWRVFCHQLESNANIDRAEQATIGVLAGYPTIDVAEAGADALTGIVEASDIHDDLDREGYDPATILSSDGMFAPGTMELNSNGEPRSALEETIPGTFYDMGGRRDPYRSADLDWGSKKWQASLLMWSACRTNTGTGSGPLWAVESWARSAGIDGWHCRVWWYTGILPGEGSGNPVSTDNRVADVGTPKLEWDGPPPSGSVITSNLESDALKISDYNSTIDDDVNGVRTLVTAMRGDNTGQRLWYGTISLVTTLGYVYLLAGLAIGTLAAKLAFGLLIVVLPITLLALAFNTGDKKASAGSKMLRLTLSMLVASAVLAFMLNFMLFLTNTIEGLIAGASGGGGGGLLGSFVPLIAMGLLYWIAKTAGIANVFNPMSMAAAPLSAGQWATASTDRKKAASKFDRSARSAGKKMVDRGSSLAKTGGLLAAKAAAASSASQTQKMPLLSKSTDKTDATSEMSTTQSALTSKADTATSKTTRAATTAAMLAGLGAGATAAATGRGARPLDRNGQVVPGSERKLSEAEAVALRNRRLGEVDRLKGTPQQRSQQAADMLDNHMASLRQTQGQLRDENGQLMFSPTGEPLFGFSQKQADGTWKALTATEAGWDPVNGVCRTSGAMAITDPIEVRSPAEVAAIGARLAGQLGVDADQLLVSATGASTLVSPQVTTAVDGTRLVRTESLATTAQLATHPMHYTSNEVKEAVMNSGLSPDAQNWAWHAMSISQGWSDPSTGHTLDLPATRGIDFSTADGLAELQRHLDGKPSKLDVVSAAVDMAAVHQIVSFARARDTSHGTGDVARIQVVERVNDSALELRSSAEHAVREMEANDVAVQVRAASKALRMGKERDQVNTEAGRLKAELDQLSVAMLAAQQQADAGDASAVEALSKQRYLAEQVRRDFEAKAAQSSELSEQLAAVSLPDVATIADQLSSTDALDELADQLADVNASLQATADVADRVAAVGVSDLDAATADAIAKLQALKVPSEQLADLRSGQLSPAEIVEQAGVLLEELVRETTVAANRRPKFTPPPTSSAAHLAARL